MKSPVSCRVSLFLRRRLASIAGAAFIGFIGNAMAVVSPAVTTILPLNGTTAGGSPVTIVGSGFTGATAVTLGGVAATGVTVINDTMIDAITGAHAAGVVDVTVTTPAGPGTGTGFYTYGAQSVAAGTVWNDRSSAGSHQWWSIASSADGSTLAAVDAGGDIWTSTDSGATWTDRSSAGSRAWHSLALSADGSKLAAAVYGGDIWTSTDSGASWTDQSSAGSQNWRFIASSADGSKLAAVALGGDIWTSTDSGATWTDRSSAGSRDWFAIAASADGSKLAAVVLGGDIWTSTDSGSTWTDQRNAGGRSWDSIASSADGSKLAAAVYNREIWTSTDSGATWTDQSSAGSQNWYSIASSADGSKLTAVVAQGDIWTSTNSGATWTDLSSAGSNEWYSIASSADGSKLAAVVYGGDIWTSASPTVTNLLPANGTTAGGTAVTIVGTGFTGATAVTLGGVAATGVTVINDTMIDATTGAHAAGVVDVTVTTPGGPGTGTGFYAYGPLPVAAGTDWTDRSSAGSSYWVSIAASADGSKLAALSPYNGDIWTSTDSGATWTDRSSAGSRLWQSIASSANGSKLVAVDFNGDIWTSTDSGATWTDRSSAGSRQWYPTASSADGSKLAAGVWNGDLWTSTDSGATWTDRSSAGSREWASIAASADGSMLAAVVHDGDIWTSTDSGTTWTDRSSAGSRPWTSIASSADGSKLAAVVNGVDIWTSTDSGATWTDRSSAGSRYWVFIASSADGGKLAALAYGGDIWTSADSGATWTDQTGAGIHDWQSIASSADGSKLTAGIYNGDIWTSVASNNANLSALTTSAVNLLPAFASGTTSYTAYVSSTTKSMTVRPTTAQGYATVQAQVNGGSFAAVTGGASGALALNAGSNTIHIQVTAQDGVTVNTYTVTVICAAAADSTPPTVTLTAPASAAHVNEIIPSGMLNVTGAAADNKGVVLVEVSLNGGTYAQAALTLATNQLTATYALLASPVPGTNTVTVRSTDTSGHVSALVTHSFTYVVVRPLTLTSPPLLDGTVTLTPALVAGQAQEGTIYTMTATPKAGYLFDSWTAPGVANAIANGNKLSFTMTAADAGATITANFIANPFPAVAGSYNGLILPQPNSPVNASTTGFFAATVNPTNGAFTARLMIDGITAMLTGNFDQRTGQASVGGASNNFAYALTLDLANPASGGAGKITGSVTQRNAGVQQSVSLINADLAAFSPAHHAPTSVLSGNGARNGVFTLAFPAGEKQAGLTSVQYPQGSGIGTATVTTAGVASFSGTLADGTAVTASAPLSKTLQWPLFALISNRLGLLAGQVTFADLPDSDLTALRTIWIKPYTHTQYYPWGWPGGILMDAIGAHYTVPTTTAALSGLGLSSLTGNATLTFGKGGLNAPVAKNVNISIASQVTPAGAADTSFTATITTGTGLMAGSFTYSTSPLVTTKFNGVILQKGANKGGYGYFLTPMPVNLDGDGQSGNVSLMVK